MLRGSTARALSIATAIASTSTARAQEDHLDPAFATDLVLTKVVGGLTSPTSARWLPDGRLVITEQLGAVYVWTGTGAPALAGTMPVAQTGGETGLLGLAVDPLFSASQRLYFYYSAEDGTTPDRHRVAWATLDESGSLDAIGKVEILDRLLGSGNHNGGGLEFGPDGRLYVGVGDKGCNCGCAPGDPMINNYFPSCLTNASGKILRIGRDGEIPPDNPLVGTSSVTSCGTSASCNGTPYPDPAVTGPPREEIWVWGLRNPWRFAFDEQTGYLWIGDVGELTYEEITISKGGGEHHGWPFREGAHGQPVSICPMVTPNAIGGACIDPAYDYIHDDALGAAGSVTAGVFSNHCSWPEPYRGLYWFADFTKLRVWTLLPNAARDGVAGDRTMVVIAAYGPDHIFTGEDGAIYYVTYHDGEIWRIGPANPVQCAPDAGAPDAEPGDVAFDGGARDTAIIDDATIDPDAGAIRDRGAANEDAGPRPGAGTEGCGCASIDRRERAAPVMGAGNHWAVGLLLVVLPLRPKGRPGGVAGG